MKRSIYNIVDIIKEINLATEEFPGKKKFQKLVYLIENLGNVNLGFKYEIHFYGPYSSELDDAVTKLSGEGFLAYNYEGNSQLICLKDSVAEDDEFFAPDLSEDEYSAMKDIINRFSHKTPGELELLTTAHYAYANLQDKSQKSVVAGVQKIKGSKFSEPSIISAIDEFGVLAR